MLCETNQLAVHSRVSPFLFPTFHQISTLEKTTCRQCSILSRLMSQRPSQVSPFYEAAHSTSSEVLSDFQIWFLPGFPMQSTKHIRIPSAASRDQIHHRFQLCCDSFFTCIFLCSFRHRFKTIGGTEMCNVRQTRKMISFIRCEISLGQYVCELGSWCRCILNMSHCGTPSFNNHLDHCFVVFKDI